MALAKARPGVLNFSGGGIGAGTHLLAAWFFQAAQIKAAYIPYATGGTAQSAIDTVAGRADAAIVTYFSAKPFLTTQRLRVLAISAARPSALLPDVPAILSQGVPGFETYTFNGFVSAVGTRPAVISRLSQELAGYAKSRDVQETIDSVRRLASVIRDEGALMIAQLNHNGRQHHGTSSTAPRAPSAIGCPRSGGMPHAMTPDEIEAVIAGFVQGAMCVQEADGDGIELHGAQGHLIQQFVSPYSNQRDDEFGGSFAKRLRFPLELITRIRKAVGRDFIVGYRFGVEEFTEGGLGIADTTRIAEQGALVPHRYFHANKPVRLQNVRGVLWAGMQRVNDGIASELRSAGFNDVRVIGDGIAPRRQGAKSSNASHRRRA